MTKAENIFLIGLMGVGKTTIGKQLARRLNWQFYDADEEIEKRSGVSVPWIFEKEGESGFRQREIKIIAELTRQRYVVLATGGGAVMNAENRATLAANGTVIYLRSDIEQLLFRMANDRNRPLLFNRDPRKVLEKLMIERGPLYQQIADKTYDTGQCPVAELVDSIIKDLAG